jgi:hypothetical protein
MENRRKRLTWTNAPLVRSARAAAILEFWSAKEEIRPPEPNALKTGFREGHRPTSRPSPQSPSQAEERPPLAFSAVISPCAAAPVRGQPRPPIFPKQIFETDKAKAPFD